MRLIASMRSSARRSRLRTASLANVAAIAHWRCMDSAATSARQRDVPTRRRPGSPSAPPRSRRASSTTCGSTRPSRSACMSAALLSEPSARAVRAGCRRSVLPWSKPSGCSRRPSRTRRGALSADRQRWQRPLMRNRSSGTPLLPHTKTMMRRWPGLRCLSTDQLASNSISNLARLQANPSPDPRRRCGAFPL